MWFAKSQSLHAANMTQLSKVNLEDQKVYTVWEMQYSLQMLEDLR